MEYLSRKSVPFIEKNIGRDPEARRELLAMGFTSLPVIVIGEEKFSGFDPARIDAALARFGGSWERPASSAAGGAG
jgi:glutaredoxin 3